MSFVSPFFKIRVNIYTDVKSYHILRNMPDAPDWLVGNGGEGDNSLDMVLPLNPGKAHTYECTDGYDIDKNISVLPLRQIQREWHY